MSLGNRYIEGFHEGFRQAAHVMTHKLAMDHGVSEDVAADFLSNAFMKVAQQQGLQLPQPMQAQQRMQQQQQRMQPQQPLPPNVEPNMFAGKPTSGPLGTAVQLGGMGIGGYGMKRVYDAGQAAKALREGTFEANPALSRALGQSGEAIENKTYRSIKDFLATQMSDASKNLQPGELLDDKFLQMGAEGIDDVADAAGDMHKLKITEGMRKNYMNMGKGMKGALGASLLGLGVYGMGKMFG